MKSRKLVWIAALCLLSATVITVSLRARPTGVLAAQHSISRASLAQPAAYMSSASLRAAAISNALLSDEAGSALRVSLNMQRISGPLLPPVEEFTLTPPESGAQHDQDNRRGALSGITCGKTGVTDTDNAGYTECCSAALRR